MIIFCCMRFVNIYLMKYIKPGRLMAFFAAVALLLLCGVIFVGGRVGMCCLVGVSACMSLMFPTIYGCPLSTCRLWCQPCALWWCCSTACATAAKANNLRFLQTTGTTRNHYINFLLLVV